MTTLTPEQQKLHWRWSEAVIAELSESGFARNCCAVAAYKAREACLGAGFDPRDYPLQQ